MKRIAILTERKAPVSEEMARILNEGSRYRVGMVPPALAAAGPDALASALAAENVDLLVLENFDRPLPPGFPVETVTIVPDDLPEDAIRRVMAACPDTPPRPRAQAAVPPSYEEKVEVRETPRETVVEAEEQPVAPEPPQAPQDAYAGYGQARPPMPSTYLIWSVLATILCCFIPGIVAIVFSSMVSTRYFNGDFEGARRASRMAEIWIIVSIVAGVISNSLYLPMMMLNMG